FESSRAYRQTTAAFSDAQNLCDREVQDTLDWLHSTDVYCDTYDAISDAEDNLSAERNRVPVDQTALSGASTAWIDAKNQIEILKRETLSTDEWVVAAQQKLAANRQAYDELLRRFMNDLDQDPNLKKLTDALAAQQQSLALAARDIKFAQARLADAQQQYAR